MCWGCNPLCGGCRPPRQKAVQCPACGWYNVVDVQCKGRPREVGCVRCPHDLTEQSVSQAAMCERFGVACANPCGLASQVEAGRDLGRCQNRVEPDEWHALRDAV